jgi:uncharacterized protein
MSQGREGAPDRAGAPSDGARRFDAWKLVTRQGQLTGKLDPFDLERLHDSLGEDESGQVPDAEITYRINGLTDPSGHAALEIAIDGQLPLGCQRCLQPFLWPVHQQTTVLLAHDEDELTYLDDNDEREVILAAAPLDPREVVEDELVLSVPYVPRCDRPECVAAALVEDATAQDQGRPDTESSPFGALAALKDGRTPDKG